MLRELGSGLVIQSQNSRNDYRGKVIDVVLVTVSSRNRVERVTQHVLILYLIFYIVSLNAKFRSWKSFIRPCNYRNRVHTVSIFRERLPPCNVLYVIECSRERLCY
jgi:hypothetical protein